MLHVIKTKKNNLSEILWHCNSKLFFRFEAGNTSINK